MFERYTERARQVVVKAQEESRKNGHAYIGTGHLLMGLLLEEEGLAAQVLTGAGFTTDRVRTELLRIIPIKNPAHSGQVPFTVQAKNLLERASDVALGLQFNYVGTEHILLAIIADMLEPNVNEVEEEECVPGPTATVAGMILARCRANPAGLRMEVLRRLSGPSSRHRGALEQYAPSNPERAGVVEIFISDAEQNGFLKLLGEQEKDFVYKLVWQKLPWARLPQEGESVFVGGNDLRVFLPPIFKMDGAVEIHLRAELSDQAPAWHEATLREGFRLVPE